MIVVIQNGFVIVIVIQNGLFLPPKKILTIGAKMNKLDSFNKDKIKCKKCKEYFDAVGRPSAIPNKLCLNCYEKFFQFYDADHHSVPPTLTWEWSVLSPKFKDWLNNEQT